MQATHNPFIYWFFRIYTRLRIKGAFRDVLIAGEISDKGLPVLVLANHFSWWDGFWVMYMNMKMFRRKFYFMMLEEELKKNIFLNRTGGYSVRKGSRSIIESLRYTAWLLEEKENMVLLFPQGKIESSYQAIIPFGEGVRRVAVEAAGRAQILFVVNMVEYFSRAKPSLYTYLAEYSDLNQDIETAYNDFYASTLKVHRMRNVSV